VKVATENELLDLGEATLEVTALLSNELQRNYVLLRTELAGDLPSINGDRVQLQQVIMNLLMNATDAMMTVEDRPRQLVVSTMRDGSRVRLTVEDVGTGFPPGDADKLFEAFYTTKNRGMGIGLSVSRCIVERHKGSLWAMPNTGPGATFAFSIPHSMESSVGHGGDISTQVAAASSVQPASGKRS
jgi:signal transduction histidine kinase